MNVDTAGLAARATSERAPLRARLKGKSAAYGAVK